MEYTSPKTIEKELKKIEFLTKVEFNPMDNGTYHIKVASLENFKKGALKVFPQANNEKLTDVTSKMLNEYMYVASELLEKNHKDFQLEDWIKAPTSKTQSKGTANLVVEISNLSDEKLSNLRSAVSLCRDTLHRFTDFIFNEQNRESVLSGNYAISVNKQTQTFSVSKNPHERIQQTNTIGILANSITTPAASYPKF